MAEFAVSVIIPMASDKKLSGILSMQLEALPADWEILFCSPALADKAPIAGDNARYIISMSGRAHCLNTGAGQAKGRYLWFLHADSCLAAGSVEKLTSIMGQDIPGLYYFDLAFHSHACGLIFLNELGAFLRCRLLGTPFGDQGFFIKKTLFDEIGEYPSYESYGEDHLLVRHYRRSRVPVRPVGIPLYTSARKYESGGWLKTTFNNVCLWAAQAVRDRKRARKS